jgi:hypothetical protein
MASSATATTTPRGLSTEKTARLFGWIEAGWRKDDVLRSRWERFRKMLTGRFGDAGMTAEALMRRGVDLDALSVNLAYLHARTQLPSIFAQDPYVDAVPPRESDAPNAPVWEALLNQALPSLKFKEECKRVVLDALVFGEGWLKWGWAGRAKFSDQGEEAPQEPSAVDQGGFIQQALSMQGYQLGAPLSGAKRTPRSRGRRRSNTGEVGADPVSYLLRDGPFCARMAPQNVVVDPLSPDRDPLRSRFVALRFLKPYEEIKHTPGYTLPGNFEDLKASGAHGFSTLHTPFNLSSFTMPGERSGSDESRKQASPTSGGIGVVWEVWVCQLDDLGLRRRTITLLEGADRPLRDVDWDSMLGDDWAGYPIHRLAFNDVPDEPPMSDFEAWAPLQQMLDLLVRRTLANIARYPKITAIDLKACVDGKQARAVIENGEDGGLIETKGPPRDVVMPLEFPQVTAEAVQMLNYMDEMTRYISGTSENRRGEAAARTATEAKIIEGSASVREREKVVTVQDFCEDGLNTLVLLFQSFVDRPYVVRRIGTGGTVQWLEFGPDQRDGSVPVIKVRFESTRFANEQKELQKWTAILNQAMALKPFLPNLPLHIITGHAWKAMGVENVQELLGPPLAPDQAAVQWLELTQMLAGIPVEPTIEEPADVHLAVIGAFKASPAFGIFSQSNPMGIELVLMHEQMHQQLKDQVTAMQQGATTPQTETDAATGFEKSPANSGRGSAQSNMPEVPALAGASNERY